MTTVDTKALDLLGKQISFIVLPKDEVKSIIEPQPISGLVESVVLHLNDAPEIMVAEHYYSFDQIKIE